jgi:glycosyltransferase involved in cell wall biosynthesis
MSVPKVLVYKPDLLPRSETFIKEQVLSLRRWHGVLVGHYRVPRGLPLDGLDLRLLMHDPPRRTENFLWRTRRLFGGVCRREVEQLAAERAQLLHAHFGTVAVDVWPLAKALGLPMLVTLHGFDINIQRDWWEAGNGGWRRRSYPKQLLRMSQDKRVHFIAVSEAIRETAIYYGIQREKITVCHIGVDTNKFRPDNVAKDAGHPRVLFVGRLVEKKGVSTLIRAFAKMSAINPRAELVIAGEGPLRNTLEALASELNVPARFIGAVSSEEVKRHLGRAQIFCLPSITAGNGDAEGLPITILEAQASGVPVITSARGGVGEAVVDGVTGYSFPEGDVDMLCQLTASLLDDPVHLASMSLNARARAVEKFSIEKLSKLLEDVYHRISYEMD